MKKMKLILVFQFVLLAHFSFIDKAFGQCMPLPVINGESSLCADHHTYTITNVNTFPGATFIWNVRDQTGALIGGQNGGQIFDAVNGNNVNWPLTMTPTQACTVTVFVTVNGCTVSSNFYIYSCCGDINGPFSFNDATIDGLMAGGLTITGQTLNINGKLRINGLVVFQGCELLMGPGSSIELLGNGPPLSNEIGFSNTMVHEACGVMWKGISLLNGAAIKVVNASVISDAQYAVQINGNVTGYFDSQTRFTQNYIGLYAVPNITGNQFNPSGPNPNSSWPIGDVTFDGSAPLLTPFVGQNPIPLNSTSYAGAVLNNMTNFFTSVLPVGTTTPSAIFQNLNAGILAYNSNIEVHNCIFQNITPLYPDRYAGIALCSETRGAARTAIIGNINNMMPNNFNNCFTAIYSRNNNLNLQGCNFVNGVGFFTDLTTGLDVFASNNRIIQVSGNFFTRVSQSIRMSSVRGSNIRIDNNVINAGSSSGNGINDFTSTGIRIFNGLPSRVKIRIYNNTIGSTGNTRIGIYLSNCSKIPSNIATLDTRIKIYDNNIQFNTLQSNITLPNTHHGIWLDRVSDVDLYATNAGSSIITSNQLFSSTLTPGSQPNQMRGINLRWVENTNVVNMKMSQLGDGIYMQGNCSGTALRCNEMEDCVYGVELLQAVLSDQGEIDPNGNAVNAWDNRWTTLGTNNTTWRLSGTCAPFSWVTQSSPDYELNQNNTLVTVLPAFLTSLSNNPCSFLPGGAEAKIGEVVEDTITYPFWPETYRFTDMDYVYRMLYDDSVLRASNPDYLTFFELQRQGNLEVFRKVEDLMHNELYAMAIDYLNSHFVPSNVVEENLFYTINLQLNKFYLDDETFSPEETILLRNIAYMTPMEGGPGVFNARAMLGLEVNDPDLILRTANPDLKIYNSTVTIYPNPTNGIINLKNADNTTIEISDAAGRVVMIAKNINKLSLEDYDNGIYYFRITQLNGEVTHSKIILKK